MSKNDPDETIIQIETTQAALRDSIEQAKKLAQDSERLVSKHREESRSWNRLTRPVSLRAPLS